MRYKTGPNAELPTLVVECDLCESWEMETLTSIVFRLRESIRWQDLEPVNGRVLTSEDIAFSYVRQSQPSFANAPLMRNVDTVQPISPLELRVTLKSQDADFFNAFADGHSKIAAREAVEQNGDLRNGPTVGTGPWILENSEPEFIHEFVRNARYFETNLPLLDNIRFHVLPDAATRSASFLVGVLDVHQMEAVEARDYLKQTPTPPTLLIREPGNGLEFAINTSQPPFDDPRVRQAAFLALDPWKAIEEHWGGFAFVSSGFPVTESGWLMEKSEHRRFLNRPLDAKAILQDAGFTAPIPVTIKLGDFGKAYLDHANSINVELQTVGFASKVEIVNRRTFGEDVWLRGDYQMFVGPSAPVSAPNGYLLPVLHSNGVWNTTGHVDDELDALLEAQAVSMDGAERRKLILEIQERTLRQGYRFMPASRISVWAWSPRVRDFHPNFAGFEYIHWSRVWLDG
jgi:ABC-type transport system substrate-binding protein